MERLRRLRPDPFILMILGAVLFGSAVPARGVGELVLGQVVTAAVFVLFFLYGGRLSTREAVAGLTHWRLHLVILTFTFVLFPLLGLALSPLSGRLLSPALYAGVLFCCLVPSTVQSSIVFTSTAGGNVPGAIVSASASNLLGVVLTPLLAAVVMRTSGTAGIDPSSVVDLVGQILLPFVLGQLSRPWTATWLAANHSWLKHVDRAVIVLVVYAAFSRGMNEGMWGLVGMSDMVALVVVCGAVLAFMLTATWWAAGILRFDRPDRIAVQFCGTKKSLATGLPMAVVLFAGQPVGLMVLPLMVFHQIQLMVCTVLAQRYADEGAG